MTTTGANGATARISPGDGCALHLELSKLTMQDLADTLAPFLDKPVIDATELKGTYKATLDLPMEVMFTMMQNMMRANGLPAPGQGGFGRGGDGGGPRSRRRSRAEDLRDAIPGKPLRMGARTLPALHSFEAVQKLGLKLQARKAPFDTIVIDRIEKTPTDN